ncbi:hypothetical protein BV25DRAFT_1842561 [Artomyces pyxidatus]|uniref:Uncharacterized protein n=1 Tax=Artomyces pyxidatus TaxID=48021 RepID=A0ACB8SHR2_9AGAM|nr:hypothetical protein BV25DRAFT_1842561 [Artomyces pyxidatus]
MESAVDSTNVAGHRGRKRANTANAPEAAAKKSKTTAGATTGKANASKSKGNTRGKKAAAASEEDEAELASSQQAAARRQQAKPRKNPPNKVRDEEAASDSHSQTDPELITDDGGQDGAPSSDDEVENDEDWFDVEGGVGEGAKGKKIGKAAIDKYEAAIPTFDEDEPQPDMQLKEYEAEMSGDGGDMKEVEASHDGRRERQGQGDVRQAAAPQSKRRPAERAMLPESGNESAEDLGPAEDLAPRPTRPKARAIFGVTAASKTKGPFADRFLTPQPPSRRLAAAVSSWLAGAAVSRRVAGAVSSGFIVSSWFVGATVWRGLVGGHSTAISRGLAGGLASAVSRGLAGAVSSGFIVSSCGLAGAVSSGLAGAVSSGFIVSSWFAGAAVSSWFAGTTVWRGLAGGHSTAISRGLADGLASAVSRGLAGAVVSPRLAGAISSRAPPARVPPRGGHDGKYQRDVGSEKLQRDDWRGVVGAGEADNGEGANYNFHDIDYDEEDEDEEDEDDGFDDDGFGRGRRGHSDREEDVKPDVSKLNEVGPSGWERYTELNVSEGGKMMGMAHQKSARVKRVLRDAGTRQVQLILCWEHPMPPVTIRDDICRRALITAAEELEETRIHERLVNDSSYASAMAQLSGVQLPQRMSAFRKRCRARAQEGISRHYNFEAFGRDGLTVAITELVDPLDDYLYIFPGSHVKKQYKTEEPFCHPAIISHLRNTFFGSQPVIRFPDHMYVLEEWGEDEPELPAPMVAFSATTVCAGLKDYQTGTYRPVDFKASDKQGERGFYDIYLDHIRTLKGIAQSNPQGYHDLMCYLWHAASGLIADGADTSTGRQHGNGTVNKKIKMNKVGQSLKLRRG